MSEPAWLPDPTLGLKANPYLSLPGRLTAAALHGLMTLPQRAFEASESMRLGGDYDPAPAVETAMLSLGMGARTPVTAAAESLASRSPRMYNPPAKPLRPFEADYSARSTS